MYDKSHSGASTQPELVFFLTEISHARVVRDGKRFGRLTDLIIKENGRLPYVTGLLVSLPFGESALIPWEKVKTLTTKEIGLEDVKTFEREAPEGAILLKDYLLDKRVLDVEGREVEVVYDIKLALRNGRLYVTDADFSRYGLLRRIGMKWLADYIYHLAETVREQTVSWTYVKPLPENLGRFRGDLRLSVLKEELADMHPVDVADILEEMPPDQRMAVFNELDTEQASDTLEEVDPPVQREVVAALKRERAAQLIDEMTPAQAADILAVLPAQEAEAILRLLSAENIAKVQPILEKQDTNILDFATGDFLKVAPEETAEQIVDSYRIQAKGKDVIMYLYVVGSSDKLLGVIDMKELLLADPAARLYELMVDNVISLHADSTLKEASDMFARYSFRAIPVVDATDKILGVVTYRDIRNLKHRFLE
jgi:magnesium transporter